jgi:glycosyltransferase involved in cell wall biosynthesis
LAWPWAFPFRVTALTALKARLSRAVAREGVAKFLKRQTARLLNRANDRAQTLRLAKRRWHPDGRPVFLLINHRHGGGTEQHVVDLRARLSGEGIRVVLARPGRRQRVLWEERDENQRLLWRRESTCDRDSMSRTLADLKPAHAHVHHVLGIPLGLIDLLADKGVAYDWTVHDYYAICPRINLVSAENAYCGEPDAVGCNRCLARLGDDQGRTVTTSIENWRLRYAKYLGRARRIFVPSDDVRDRLERYFPEMSFLLRPHPETLPDLQSLASTVVPGERVRVAVVGTLTAIKGSETVRECAVDAIRRGLNLEFHVIGSTDSDALFGRIPNVRIWGRYRPHQVYARLAAARCHVAFLPSLWPETYMYTLSAVMASGLYTICFDLGAQAARLRRWGWGEVLPLAASHEAINDRLMAAAARLSSHFRGPSPPPPARYRDMLGSYYGFSAEERARFFQRPAGDPPLAGTKPHLVPRKDHARFH